MNNNNEKEEFEIKYIGVTDYTMKKLKRIENIRREEVYALKGHIFKAAIAGIFALSMSVVPVTMINNHEFIKENLFKFLIAGVGLPLLGYAGVIKHIRDAIKSNKYVNDIADYLDECRKDIPLSYIERECDKDDDNESEMNDMLENSKEPKFIRKFFETILG